MDNQARQGVTRPRTTRREEKKRRLQLVSSWTNGRPREKLVKSLESLIVAGDRIVPEGDNQKQASTRILSRYPGDLRFGDDPWSGRPHAEVTVL